MKNKKTSFIKIISALLFRFTIVLILIIGLFIFLFIQAINANLRNAPAKMAAYDKALAKSIQSQEFEKICLTHSYGTYGNSVEIQNKIILIPENSLPSPDDGIWVIIGISENNKNKAYAIDREAVLKYFDSYKTQCKKL
ncbi:MAG: hypothetical protein ACRBDI_09410 [Alphaproteobacteria bacterium]